MTRLTGARVLVAGAGAIGSVLSLILAQEGARVILADPAPVGDNASGVAAGMLAPAFEAVLDPTTHGRFELLAAARDAWTPLAEATGLTLDRSGALWVDDERQDDIERGLAAAGARAERLSAAAAGAFAGLAVPVGAVFTPEDWRIEPLEALDRLRAAFVEAGGEVARAGLVEWRPGVAGLSDGRSAEADFAVVAAGFGAQDLAPELGVLEPIKGQIVRLTGPGPRRGATARTREGYVAPGAAGVAAGATMLAGANDRRPDPEVTARFEALARRLHPGLNGGSVQAQAGVRAATPDGMPLVGFGRTPGLLLATGARRNGWLLAPLVARMAAAYLAGDEPGPHAAAFAPGRFDP